MLTKTAARNMSSLLCMKALQREGEVNEWFHAGALLCSVLDLLRKLDTSSRRL